MRDRSEQVLRLACVVLGALLVFQIARIVARRNPLAHLQIPTLPTLAAADTHTGAKATNAAPVADSTKKSTNAVRGATAPKDTNSAAPASTTKGSTNPAPELASQKAHSNAVAIAPGPNAATNLTAEQAAQKTNSLASPQAVKGNTNSPSASDAGKTGSNSVAQTGSTKAGSNSVSRAGAMSNNPTQRQGRNLPGGPPGVAGPPGMAGKPRELPPEIWARVDRVTDSEILGPVMRPLPMALLGIAGNIAFLRAPNSQTGLVKEGDGLGGLNLLRIGINRVLVEQEGQKKELMIFSGFGGESLLPK